MSTLKTKTNYFHVFLNDALCVFITLVLVVVTFWAALNNSFSWEDPPGVRVMKVILHPLCILAFMLVFMASVVMGAQILRNIAGWNQMRLERLELLTQHRKVEARAARGERKRAKRLRKQRHG